MLNKTLPFLILIFSSIVYADKVEQDIGYFDLELAGNVIDEIVTDIPDDLLGIVRAPFDSPDAARDYALILGGLILTDKYTTEFYQDHIEDQFDIVNLPEINGDNFPSGFSESDRYLVLGLGGAYAGSVIASDAKGQAAALLSAKAMTYSYITSQVILKTLFGRNRPHRYLSNCSNAGEVIEPGFTCDNLDFGNERDNVFKAGGVATAMPSFHATMLFSVARVYQQTYGDYLVPYSVAAILFANDGKGHNHWMSDLFLGGIIGTVIGDVVTDNFFGDNEDLSVVPIVNNESQGMALSYRF
jgi:hypothetical protein